MKKYYLMCFITLLFLMSSCGSSSSFVKGDGGWTSVQIADRISYEIAFEDVSSLLAKNFEISQISKEAGYISTAWNTTWTKKGDERFHKDYRVRVIVKMSPERKRIDINAEAQKRKGRYWMRGYDTDLLQTVKEDIAGSVGF